MNPNTRTTKNTLTAMAILAVAALVAAPSFFASRSTDPYTRVSGPHKPLLNFGEAASQAAPVQQEIGPNAFETPQASQAALDAANNTLLRWGHYRFDAALGLPELPRLRGGQGTGPAPASPQQGYGYMIVQNHGVIDAQWRGRLEGAGAQIVGYAHNNAYVVRVPSAKAGAVRGMGRGAVDFAPAFKMTEPVEELAVASNPYLTKWAKSIDEQGRLEFAIGTFPGVRSDAVLGQVLGATARARSARAWATGATRAPARKSRTSNKTD